MTLENFNSTIRNLEKKGQLYDNGFVLNKEMVDLFNENEEALVNEFFQILESDIKNLKFSNISDSLPILVFEPIKSKDYNRYNNIIFSAAENIKTGLSNSDFNSLSWFIWLLLDHKLHTWYTEEGDFNIKLAKFKLNLLEFEKLHEERVQLLYQKMEHFGVA